jgi:hypothetical protein
MTHAVERRRAAERVTCPALLRAAAQQQTTQPKPVRAMILVFPDLDTLRLCLTSSTVPADVTLAPAAVSFDDQNRIYVEPTVSLSKTTTKSLDRLGVKGSKRHGSDDPEQVASWVQILPVTRDAGVPNTSSQAAVLFELGSADDLPTLVTEMLRLGNDRQGFRWFAAPDDLDTRRVLLRVIGPPYYTLLRALDKTTAGTTGPVRAYLERAPRVWVEIGYAHPLAAQVRVAEKQLVLIRHPREWVFLDDAPFQDVYDILQFKLPSAPVGWAEAKAPKKMTVPLRLTAGNAAEVPELWVLREDAVQQLDTLVRDADDRLTQRLMFAVAADPKGQRTVVLRTRPSKLAPPVLPLENALGFKPFWKLPNLFLPVGKRLHPTLRRDAVRKLLADDADQVVWLYPDSQGGFTPESVPDAAFRSLEDWVDYVIEAEQKPLAAWIEATRFDFDHFVCKDTGGPKTRPDKGDKEPTGKDEEVKAPKGVSQPAKSAGKGKGQARPTGPADFLPPPLEVKPLSEWKIRREALEKQFMAVEGSLDAPERQALWPELARANSGEGAQTEAAICWLNALWDTDPMPAEWLGGWVRSELPQSDGTLRADDFDRRLHTKVSSSPSVSDARVLTAAFLWLSHQNPVPHWLVTRLPAIQKYLEAHEQSLPVRAVWLAGYRLAQLAGADVLGLARVRDRLLLRLLDRGLEPERDLPMFLRVAGLKDSERLRVVRDKALDLHHAVREWTRHVPQNQPYVDLLFAFALGKLGETTPARKLIEDARREMEVSEPAGGNVQQDQARTAAVVKNFLFKAFRYRVEQVMAGKPHAGQMSAELFEALDEIGKKGGAGPVNNPYKLAEYAIVRMREQSRIMEPQEKPDPYAAWTKHGDALKAELAALPAIREPAKLADKVRRLYKDGVGGKPLKEVQFHLLHEVLPLSPRVGEAFGVELLNLVPAALAATPTGGGTEPPDIHKKQGELLERSMALAAHYDRGDLLQKLVSQFANLVHSKPEETRFHLVNVVAGQCLRSLRRFGLRDEIDRFLTRLHSEVLQGKPLLDLRKKYAAKPETWGNVLQTQLNLAAGWLTFGLNERAAPILDEARTELLSANGVKLAAKDYTELAKAYVTALGQGPSEVGLPRITELFRKMDPGKITNTWTTHPYYSRLHLNLVESVIQAIVSDEFALGPAGRRWLDDDEYLVRRRIHADMKRELKRDDERKHH